MSDLVADRPIGDPADPQWFRRVLGQYPTGVCVVTARESDGRRAGFVVGSFTSVSLDPPLVAFFPDKRSTSWPRIQGAGRFCVNILGAEQEDVCRRFASKADDKFAGIDCRETESGSPLIEGVVAWIDCELESVTEAGDHYIVLGRVRGLDIESPSLPLLFFQGGYGRFAPRSLATSDSRLAEQLRDVDLVRPVIEGVTEGIPGARANLWVLVDDEIVLVASAGGVGSTSPATLVGQRLPFTLPLGNAFAAWMDDLERAAWLQLLPDDAARADSHERLSAVRSRGYSLSLRTEAQRQFESTLARLAADPRAVDRDDLHGQIRKLDHELVELSPANKRDVAVVRVPIFGRDGRVAMQLSVYGFPPPAEASAIDTYINQVRDAGRRATDLLNGRGTRPRGTGREQTL